MAQKTGALIFDEQTDRYDIRFDIADYYGGLHCGECFDVFTGGKWKPTRIEMSAAQEWYLVGIRAEDLNGLRVRIYCAGQPRRGQDHLCPTPCRRLYQPQAVPPHGSA